MRNRGGKLGATSGRKRAESPGQPNTTRDIFIYLLAKTNLQCSCFIHTGYFLLGNNFAMFVQSDSSQTKSGLLVEELSTYTNKKVFFFPMANLMSWVLVVKS